jgi:hypothetical protein
VSDPRVPANRDTDAVVLTGASFGTWSAPQNFTGQLPLVDLTECQTFDEQCAHNRYVDPALDTEDRLGQGTPIERLLGYRWDGASRTWKQIPFQVDEQFTRYLDNSASGFSVYSGQDEHTTYAFDREGFRYTKSDPYDPADPDRVCQAKPASLPAYDPVKGLDSNDELAFMASDAGPEAPGDAALPRGIESAKRVLVSDPTDPSAKPSYVYVMRAGANGPKPAFDAGNGYVSYRRDPGADTFAFSQSSYSGYGNAAPGPYCDAEGHVVRNPDGTLKQGRRRPRDGATISTSRYRYRYDGRWLMTKIQVSADGGKTYGRDLVDRWKARAFAQDAASETPCCGYEEEDTNWGGSSTLLGERAGPVRTIRETWGADSGTNVVRRETFYREQMQQRTWLRVHVIPPLDGIYAQWDFNSDAVNRFYNAHLDATKPEGVAVDGKNDEAFGNLDDPCNENWDANDTGEATQTYRAAYRDLRICDVSPYHQSVDAPDLSFSSTNAGLAWSQVSGPSGSIVDRITTSVRDLTPGGAAQSTVAVPYYRDDACFDDGTGNDPGPKVKKRSADEPSTYGSPPAPRECWDSANDGDTHSTDEAPNPRFYQGSIGTHGVHLLFLVESDNARQQKPVNEIVSDWQMVMLEGDPGNVGERYGRSFEKPLVPLVSDHAAGSRQYGEPGGAGTPAGGGQGGSGSAGADADGHGASAQSGSSRCAAPTGRIRGLTLGRAVLGRSRGLVRRAFPSFRRARRRVDRFCLRDGAHVRVGYRRERAVLLLASSRRYAVRAIRHGSGTRSLRRSFPRARSFRIGHNRWYVARGRRALLVFKTRGGRVQEVGLAERRATRSAPRAQRFLSSFSG